MPLNNLKNLADLAHRARAPKIRQVLTVPIGEVISKQQVRKRFRNIAELAASMVADGQQSPIIVYPKNAEGQYVIQKGERRWRACRHAGIPTIDILVNEKSLSDLEEVAGELIENVQRDDLTALEVSFALEAFRAAGWKQTDIAKRIGKTKAYVSIHLSLLDLPPQVRELHDQDICTDYQTLYILKQIQELDPASCSRICTAGKATGGVSRSAAQEVLQSLKKKSDSQGTGIPAAAAGHSVASECPITTNSDTLRGTSPDQELHSLAAQPDQKSEPISVAWTEVAPGDVSISVQIEGAGQGRLVTTRISRDPDRVWVQASNGAMTEVPVGNVRIVGVAVAQRQETKRHASSNPGHPVPHPVTD